MRTKFFYILAIIILAGSTTLFARGFLPPQKGKAAVYFVRIDGGYISFIFFHQDKYIGEFKGKSYLKVECDAGKQLFWAASNNKYFITSDLAAGKSYIVLVNRRMTGWREAVELEPISSFVDKDFKKAKDLIKKKDPVVITDKEITDMNKEYADFITEKLNQYNEVWKKEKDFSHISPEMAVPEDAMK